jgi:DNA-binding transcriptional ArsR family regulator
VRVFTPGKLEFKHAYSQIILSALKERSNQTFSQIYKQLSESYPGINLGDSTVSDHLKRLVEAGRIDNDDNGRYSLTLDTKFELELFDSFELEPVKSKREPRSLYESEDKDKDKNKKACLLVLLQAASGTQRFKVVNEPVLGAIARYNPVTRRDEPLVSYKQPGVTIKEILEHTDIGHGGLFRHVNFTSTTTRDYVEILRNEFGLPINNTVRNGEFGIEITDEGFRGFLELFGAMIFQVQLRIKDTIANGIFNILYKKEIENTNNISRKWVKHLQPSYSFQQKDATRWYLAIYGEENLNHLYHNCERAFAEQIRDIEKNHNKQTKTKTKRDIGIRAKWKEIRRFIQNRARQIEQYDKSIIAYYHGYIKCDKIVDFPGGSEYRDKHYKYVINDMPEKYHLLTDILIKLAYPEFLQRFHETNPTLVEFTDALPKIKAEGIDETAP